MSATVLRSLERAETECATDVEQMAVNMAALATTMFGTLPPNHEDRGDEALRQLHASPGMA